MVNYDHAMHGMHVVLEKVSKAVLNHRHCFFIIMKYDYNFGHPTARFSKKLMARINRKLIYGLVSYCQNLWSSSVHCNDFPSWKFQMGIFNTGNSDNII